MFLYLPAVFSRLCIWSIHDPRHNKALAGFGFKRPRHFTFSMQGKKCMIASERIQKIMGGKRQVSFTSSR